MEFLATHGGRFVDGAIMTAQQTVLAIIVAVAISLLMGLMRLSHSILLRGVATVYIEIFRGTS
ncbi:MAG: ectoine/hydroxyectoine ABC transporter permease subunit EhuC, partial [Kiloniellales bacterium]